MGLQRCFCIQNKTTSQISVCSLPMITAKSARAVASTVVIKWGTRRPPMGRQSGSIHAEFFTY